MNLNLFRKLTYQRCAIALTGLCVAALYAMVASSHFSADEQSAAPSRTGAIDPSRPLLRGPIQVAMLGSAEKLFNLIDYRLDGVRRHGTVPRVFLASLPRKLPQIQLPKVRKVMFIKTTLPLILHVNELIQHDRSVIKSLLLKKESGMDLSDEDVAWLREKTSLYGLDGLDLDELLQRVDVIPPSLAIAQSAQESGWGTSRFAHEGNALFGQRTFRDITKGIVPKERDKGKTYRVRAFDQLIDGVKSYAHNFNTHPAYTNFRALRARLRRDGEALDGRRLADALKAYSELGEEYVKAIKSLIRYNDLHQYDKARLGKRVSVGVDGPDA